MPLPPLPVGVPPGHSYWNDWYEKLRRLINTTSFNHNDLLNIQGGAAGDYYHLTAAQHTDLTDGGSSTLHTHDHGGLGGLTDDDHTQYILASGTRPLTADWDAGSFEVRAQTFESDVTTGTAPLVVASTTVVTNLNADLLDGQHASAFQASDVMLTDISALSDPGADRLLFWDDSAGAITWLTAGTGLTITDTTITASASAPALDDLTDVTITAAATGDYLRYNGSAWVDVDATQLAADVGSSFDHGGLTGLADNDHPQYLLVTDIDDTPVNGELAQPISSNWAFDHVAAADPHTGYRLESADHTHQSTGLQGGQLDHGLALTGLSDNDHPQYLLVVDIDDVPVNGEIAQPISSNWAFDHVAAADPHTGYRLESADHNHQSAGAQAGQLDHGLALTGLGDDDHTQYLLASAATDRATFAANWTDLTDGGSTTLHVHPATGVTNFYALIATRVSMRI